MMMLSCCHLYQGSLINERIVLYCIALSHITTLRETVGARVSTLAFVRGDRHILILLVEQPSERARHQQSVASSDICPSELQVAKRAFESSQNAIVQLRSKTCVSLFEVFHDMLCFTFSFCLLLF